MEFEKYRLTDADCAYMWQCVKPGKDKKASFCLPLVRNTDNQQTHYDGVEYPPRHQNLRNYLRLMRIFQYKNLPQKATIEEPEIFLFLVFSWPLTINWVDEQEQEIPDYTHLSEIPS